MYLFRMKDDAYDDVLLVLLSHGYDYTITYPEDFLSFFMVFK